MNLDVGTGSVLASVPGAPRRDELLGHDPAGGDLCAAPRPTAFAPRLSRALPADDFVAPPTEEQRLWHGPGTEEAEAERPGTGGGLAGPGLWELWAPGLAPGGKL